MSTPRLPPCAAIGPDGRRIVVHPAAPTDTVGDLARALSLPELEPVRIDERTCDPHLPLIRSGLRIGSRISSGPADSPTPSPAPVDEAVAVGVIAGPACRSWSRLGVGRHVVGRARTADVRVEDPNIELHHGVLEVGVDRTVTFNQLTGRVPARIDDRPCTTHQHIDVGEVLQLGTSRLAVRRSPVATSASAHVVRSDHDPWRLTLRRSPVHDAPLTLPTPAIPDEPSIHRGPPAVGLVGAAIAVAGAGLMAAVLGQMLLALFAGVGAIASLATWAIGSVSAMRQRRRAIAEHRRQLAEFVARLEDRHDAAVRHHRVRHLGIVDALTTIDGIGEDLWERRPRDEPLRATIGPGSCRSSTGIGDDQRRNLEPEVLAALERCERLLDVPVPVTLPADSALALQGDVDTATALARSIILQLAALYGPADWRLVVVTDRPSEWDWVDWLPHSQRDGGVVPPDEVTQLLDADGTRARPDGFLTVVVTDVAGLLAARTGPLRRYLVATGGSCIVLTAGAVPALCQRVLELGATGAARWIHGIEPATPDGTAHITVAGVSRSQAIESARRLAPLVDPEDGDASAALPTEIQLGDLAEPDARLLDADAATVVRRWRSHGEDPPLTATIGLSTDGLVDVDLVRDGPHCLIAGTTGSGKSELLRTLVVSIAANVGPDHVTFVLVDFKGGSTFDACARLPHTVGVVTDLEGGLAGRALVSLDAEVRRRELLLRIAGAADLTDYRRTPGTDPLPRLVVVIDEFAVLAKDHPDVLDALVGVAQRGRSLGVHLVLATQRPAGVVTDDIRANTNLRLALRLNDRADAHDVVGDDMPARFPRSIAGRAAMRLGPDELVVFQAASCSGPAPDARATLRVEAYGAAGDASPDVPSPPSELERAVDLLRDAAAIAGSHPPHRPWLPPLPPIVTPEEIEPGAVGVVDDPANQRRLPLRWDHQSGNLLLVGSLGSGTTSTAIALVVAIVRSGPPHRHVYVIDGRGDPAWDVVAGIDECGAVVRLHESERLVRLLTRLTGGIDHRDAMSPDVVLVIDGLDPTRLAVASLDPGETAMRLERVLQEGPTAGIATCATTDGRATMPTAERWTFRVDDPTVAIAAGGGRPLVPAAVAGRLLLGDSGLEAQVVFDPDAVTRLASTGQRAPRIDVLPAHVRPEQLTTTAPRESPGLVPLLIGIASADLSPAHLLVPSGDHVFVGGAARTGRTTALRQLAAAWSDLHPSGEIVDIGGRTAPRDIDLSSRPRRHTAPMLLVVDDAERVTDPSGSIADVVAGRHPGVMILAAARLEAARAAYGHWIRDVARCHCGLILTAAGDVDGELLGTVLPRRTPMPARPGLAWMIDGRGHQLVQVADRMPQ